MIDETTSRVPIEGKQDSDPAGHRSHWILLGAVVALGIMGLIAIGPREILTKVVISLTEDTEYSPGYSEDAFRGILIGDTEASVRHALGAPLSERTAVPYVRWLFTPDTTPVADFEEHGKFPDVRFSFTSVEFGADGVFTGAFGQIPHGSTANLAGVSGTATILGDGVNSLALTQADIEELKDQRATSALISARFGKPQAQFESDAIKWLQYSRSPGSRDYRQRLIGIDQDGKVCRKVASIWWD